MPSARWRNLAGLGILLGAVALAAQSIADDALRLAAISLTTLVMAIAWLSMASPRSAALSIWVLGAGSVVLTLLLPNTGAVIGIVAALVNAALHMSVRGGAVAAALLGLRSWAPTAS
jgi:membrane-bound ClpP family serine protease